MNKNLSEAIEKMGKVQALMTAYEAVYLDLDVPPEERARADMAISTFYAIWDHIKGLEESLEAGGRLPSGRRHLCSGECTAAHLDNRVTIGGAGGDPGSFCIKSNRF